MPNILNPNNINASGNILPRDGIRLYGYSKLLGLDPDKASAAVARAQEYLDNDIPFLPLSLYRCAEKGESTDAFKDAYSKRRQMLSALTVAQLYEDSDAFIDKICDLCWAISEESSWLSPSNIGLSATHPGTDVPEVYNSERLHGLDLDATATAAGIALVLHYLKDRIDGISPFICERIEYILKDRCTKPFIFCDFSRFTESASESTACTAQMLCNILLVCAVVEEDMSVRRAMADKCIREFSKLSFAEDSESAAAVTSFRRLLYDISGGRIEQMDKAEPAVSGNRDSLPYDNISEYLK